MRKLQIRIRKAFMDILRIGVVELRNGARAERIDLSRRFAGAIPLEIAMELAFGKRAGEGILRIHEMVHPDKRETGLHKAAAGIQEKFELMAGIRARIFVEGALVRLERREMRVAVEGDAVGVRVDGLLDALREVRFPLTRKTVDEIEVDVLEMKVPGKREKFLYRKERRFASDDLEEVRAEVLDSVAHAGESYFREGAEAFLGDARRSALDGDFRVRSEGEAFPEAADEFLQISERNARRRSAAELDPSHGARSVDPRELFIHFRKERLEIAVAHLRRGEDFRSAAAEEAAARAERNVKIEA